MSVVPLVPEPQPGADDQEFYRKLSVTWASDIVPEAVTWAWMDGDLGRLPAGALALAAGREATGKSSFAVWMAAQVSRGQLPGAWFGVRRNVLYVAVEDSWQYTLVPRLMAAGADLNRIGRMDAHSVDGDDLTLSLPGDLDELEEIVLEHEVAMVIIDPLISTIGGGVDTHNERDTRKVLDPLARFADRTGVVVLGIAHFNKSGGTDASSLITGSGAFKNVPRAILAFARSSDGETRVMTQAKNSLGRDDLPSLLYSLEPVGLEVDGSSLETAKFVLQGVSSRTVAEVLHENRSDPDTVEERRNAAEFIRAYLEDADGEAPASEVLEAGIEAGYPRQSLKNARSKVAGSGKQGFGRKQVVTWRLHR